MCCINYASNYIFFCLLFNMNLGGSFDNGDYKEYFKESFLSSIYLNFLIGTLINTAALFVFNVAGVIIVYIILFVGMFFFDKKFRKYY